MNTLGGDLLQRAELLLREGKRQEARPLLIEFVRGHPTSARGWWMLSFAVSDVRQQIDCMEHVLKIDPGYAPARARLEKLQSRLAPGPSEVSAVSTPARPPVPADAASQRPRIVRKPSSASSKPNWFLLAAFFSVFCIFMLAAGLWAVAIFMPQQTSALEPTQGVFTMPPTWTPQPTSTFIPLPTHLPTDTALPPTPTVIFALPPAVVPPSSVGPNVGMYAPDFSLKNVGTGKQESLSEHQGQPMVILFWATWCGYCAREMPSLEKIYEHYRDAGLVILAVDVGESATKTRNYRKSHGLTFAVLNDSGSSVARKYHVTAYPTHFFVDSTGRVAAISVGMLEYVSLEAKIQALFALSP